MKIKKRINIIFRIIKNLPFRWSIKNRNFTIISQNCWGGHIYEELGLQYNTPFVGLFIYAPCYLKLLQNLNYYIKSNITFIKASKYNEANEWRKKENNYYPIGLLGNDIEIHFLHYKSEKEAFEKWYRRLERMNMKNLFIYSSDRDLMTESLLMKFDSLYFVNKLCFTAKQYPHIRSAVWLKYYKDQPYIGDIYDNPKAYKNSFDVAKWLNSGDGIK